MENAETKQWYLSKGVWGGIVAAVIGVLSMFGVGAVNAEQETITELIMQIVSVIAGIVAVYGRITANKNITKPTNEKKIFALTICLFAMFLGGCLYADQTTKAILQQEAIVINEINKRCQDSNDCNICRQGLQKAAEYAEKVVTLSNGGK